MRRTSGPWPLLLPALVTGWASEVLTVSSLTREGQVLVSLEFAGAYSDDVRSTFPRGLRTTFDYGVRPS